MPQGVYKRTKKHREDFKKRMHTPEIAKKRWESRRKNEEKRKKEEIKAKEILVKDNKFDGAENRIENLDKDELNDKLASIRYLILAKVRELGKNMKTLQNLQDKRDKIEIRLEEMGVRLKNQ